MALRIDPDHRRFRDIVRGKIRQNLRKYISSGELIGRKGKDKVSIPVPQIEVPRFHFGHQGQGGVGQGPGKVGDVIAPGEPEEGTGKAGSEPGEHMLEVELSLEELAEILGEELSLPRVLPKGKERLFRQALRRQIMMGKYDPKRPMVVPVHDDRRYRSWKTVPMRQSNALMIFIMDVSGSMGDEQKEIVRIESFWIDTWLRAQYDGLESRYIVHDATAREVDRDTFFRTRESGGTMISSAYKLCAKMIAEDFPASEWNIYPFQFSDGDNWSSDDTGACVEVLKRDILPYVNLFCYGQVESPYGTGQFIKDLTDTFAGEELVVTSEIKSKDGIADSIRTFLGKGK
jgi:uncharacterized sporulation protein YeaH/YhbH (DUF444 family)